jgi:hypothetical protein
MSRDHPDLNDYYQLYLFNYENERIIFLHNSFKVCYRCVCFLFIDQKSKYYINNPLTFDVGKKPWKNRKILKLWYVGQLEIFIIIYREEIKFESESRPQTRKNSSRSRFFFLFVFAIAYHFILSASSSSFSCCVVGSNRFAFYFYFKLLWSFI